MTSETSRDPNEGQTKAAVHAAPAPAATSEKQSLPSVPASASPVDRVPRRFGSRRITIGAIALAVCALAVYAAPTIYRILNTISTDDAYVNGHVTSVAARVPGQVTNVYVDDNYRVSKGSLLVQLDKEPYRIQVALKKAAYENAEANLIAAYDQVRGLIGETRSNRFKLQHAIEDVDNQIAVLRANVATLANRRATLVRARRDYNRAVELGKTPGAIAPQDVDQKREAFDVAQAQVTQALESVYQVRVGLGLPAKPEKDGDEYLGQVPGDLDQTYSSVRQALATLLQSAAALNVIPKSYTASPKEIIEEFYQRDPKGNLDNIYMQLIKESPVIKLAQAKRDEAKADWDQAELNLRYCDVVAEIDGVITRRNVNPGNNVQAGEGLMALRSLSEIWVDANFKETQLRELRIGQPAELEVDMYGSHKSFKGRISGFTYGTGSTLALLPPENATGNFIKVVQRLPVRIDLIDYDPDKDPLFVGLSVVPHVYYKEPATGADAGKRLQLVTPLPQINPDRFRMNPVPAASEGPGTKPTVAGPPPSQPAEVQPKNPGSKAASPTRPAP
jgi:membrane fusion protein (multidrug efflux system)